MRDKFLHTNCLAALANMSGQFRSLHPYVAQRLVSLFETLAKKHSRLDHQLKQPLNGGVSATAVTTAVTTNPSATTVKMPKDEVLDMSDPAIADDMVRLKYE